MRYCTWLRFVYDTAPGLMYCCVSDAGDAAAVPSSDVTAAKQSNFRSKKRPPASDVEVYQRKIKRIRERLQCGSPIESNAVMVLNEYDKDLKYEVVGQIGPVHSPSFTIQLVVNGQVSTLFSNIIQHYSCQPVVRFYFAFFMPPTVLKGAISIAFVHPSVCPSVTYITNNLRT